MIRRDQLRSHLLRASLVAGFGALLALAVPAVAVAHANLERSDPAEGAQLDAAPDALSLTFTETPDPELSSIELLDGSGSAVPLGATLTDPSTPKTLVAPIPEPLEDGTYTVTWRVVSEEDGHTTAGAFAFGVGESPTEAPVAPEAPEVPGVSALAVVAKVLLYAGLAILVAAAIVGLVALGGRVPARTPLLLGAGLVALLGALTLFVAEARTLDVSLRALADSGAGVAFVRVVIATTVAAVLATVAAFVPGSTTLILAGAGGAAAMLMRADGGHAAAASPAWLQVGLQWIHFLAVGTWIGGLALVLGYVRGRQGGRAPVEEVRRYSRLAGWAVLLVVATGVLRAANELGGFGWWFEAFATSYGTTLVVKIAVVAGIVALGAWNRYRSIPRLDDAPRLLRRVMTIEVAGAVGVFALTGVLTSLPPEPTAATPPPPPQRLMAEGSDFATTMRVSLTVTPGEPGPNRFALQVLDYDTGDALPVDRATLRFDTPSRPQIPTSRLELAADGARWSADGSQLSVPGAWIVTAAIQQGDQGTEIPLALVVADPNQRDQVSAAPEQPTIHTITYPGGQQLQVYLDPDVAGPGQLHLTAFDAQGNELRIRELRIVAVPPERAPQTLAPERFSPGHFVTPVELSEGSWSFVLVADTATGDALTAAFDQTVAP
ncbi:MAG TPA: copper resistance protein CopC [Actinomycetota bacterium]